MSDIESSNNHARGDHLPSRPWMWWVIRVGAVSLASMAIILAWHLGAFPEPEVELAAVRPALVPLAAFTPMASASGPVAVSTVTMVRVATAAAVTASQRAPAAGVVLETGVPPKEAIADGPVAGDN